MQKNASAATNRRKFERIGIAINTTPGSTLTLQPTLFPTASCNRGFESYFANSQAV
jgi:hypothetical protein